MLYAEEVLCRPDREIVMLNVATGKTPAEAGSLAAPRFIDQEQYEWSDWQEEFSMRFSQCAQGARHRVSVRVGEPASTIVSEARAGNAELIVLSWGGTFAAGHGLIVRRLLENTANESFLRQSASEDADERLDGVRDLGTIDDPKVADALLQAANDTDGTVAGG
jgi:hypothetical protein